MEFYVIKWQQANWIYRQNTNIILSQTSQVWGPSLSSMPFGSHAIDIWNLDYYNFFCISVICVEDVKFTLYAWKMYCFLWNENKYKVQGNSSGNEQQTCGMTFIPTLTKPPNILYIIYIHMYFANFNNALSLKEKN